jgi:hypothetical protein
MVASVLRTNEVFGALESFEPGALLDAIGDARSVREVGDALGLFDVLPVEQAEALKEFLTTIPGSLDAAMVAGMRNALERGVRAQLTWQPGYDFELRAWEVSEGSDGLANLQLLTPHPPEP